MTVILKEEKGEKNIYNNNNKKISNKETNRQKIYKKIHIYNI